MARDADISTEMETHAKAAIEMVLAEYDHTLDLSEPSIGDISAILNALWQSRDISDEFIETAALLFGSYIGEAIRHNFILASWDKTGSESAFLRINGVNYFPIEWCYRQLKNGPTDSVVDQYIAFREAAHNAHDSAT